MKRFVVLLLVLVLLCFTLIGCKSTSYEETKINEWEEDFGGYFTTVKQWGGRFDGYYYILYANDTKVIYLYYSRGYQSGITPLYNADGTLQIYESIN